MTTARQILTRIAQLIALVVCGITLAAGAMWWVDYTKNHWVPDVVWVNLAVFTVLTFTLVALKMKHQWRRISFWSLLSLLLVIHTIVYAVLLVQLPSWRIPWFMG